jgi:predicted secreted protein
MALTAVLAKELILYIGTDVLAQATDFDLEVNKETVDITTLDAAGWKKFLVDLKEWKVSVSALFLRGTEGASETANEEVLSSLINSDAAISLAIKSATVGDQYVTGSAFLTSYKMSGSVGDKVTWSSDFQGTGALSLSTV